MRCEQGIVGQNVDAVVAGIATKTQSYYVQGAGAVAALTAAA